LVHVLLVLRLWVNLCSTRVLAKPASLDCHTYSSFVGVSRLNANQGSVQILKSLNHFLKLFAITNQPTMASQYKREEDAIKKALYTYLERKRVNSRITLTEIAKELNVSYHQLTQRHQGYLSRTTRPRTNLRLDTA
jgi:hypothetical protein